MQVAVLVEDMSVTFACPGPVVGTRTRSLKARMAGSRCINLLYAFSFLILFRQALQVLFLDTLVAVKRNNRKNYSTRREVTGFILADFKIS